MVKHCGFDTRMEIQKRYRIPKRLLEVASHIIIQIGFDFYILKSRSGIYDESIVSEISFDFVDTSFLRECILKERNKDENFDWLYHGKNYVIYGNDLEF